MIWFNMKISLTSHHHQSAIAQATERTAEAAQIGADETVAVAIAVEDTEAAAIAAAETDVAETAAEIDVEATAAAVEDTEAAEATAAAETDEEAAAEIAEAEIAEVEIAVAEITETDLPMAVKVKLIMAVVIGLAAERNNSTVQADHHAEQVASAAEAGTMSPRTEIVIINH